MAAFEYLSSTLDPFDSDTPSYARYRTASEGGTDPQLTCPALPNYPDTRSGNASTRYFMEFPGQIDMSDLGGTRTLTLKDGATELSRVTGVPVANQYRVSPVDSERRTVFEMNVSQAGNAIDYDFWIIGGILNGQDFNDINITGNLTIEGDLIDGTDDLTILRTTTDTNSVINTVNIKNTCTANMVPGFGTSLSFVIEDTAAVENVVGLIEVERQITADNTSRLAISSYNAGSKRTGISIAEDGITSMLSYGMRTKIGSSTSSTITKPTLAQVISAFGTANTVGTGFVGIMDHDKTGASANTYLWLAISDGSTWFPGIGQVAYT